MLARGPLARVVDAHLQEHRLAVALLGVLGDLDALDRQARQRLERQRERLDQVRVPAGQRLHLLVVVVQAPVAGAVAAGQRGRLGASLRRPLLGPAVAEALQRPGRRSRWCRRTWPRAACARPARRGARPRRSRCRRARSGRAPSRSARSCAPREGTITRTSDSFGGFLGTSTPVEVDVQASAVRRCRSGDRPAPRAAGPRPRSPGRARWRRRRWTRPRACGSARSKMATSQSPPPAASSAVTQPVRGRGHGAGAHAAASGDRALDAVLGDGAAWLARCRCRACPPGPAPSLPRTWQLPARCRPSNDDSCPASQECIPRAGRMLYRNSGRRRATRRSQLTPTDGPADARQGCPDTPPRPRTGWAW